MAKELGVGHVPYHLKKNGREKSLSYTYSAPFFFSAKLSGFFVVGLVFPKFVHFVGK